VGEAPLAFDHAVVLVPDLEAAVRECTGLGFVVVPGGVHEGGATHNALIPLADGTYLELLAPTPGRTIEVAGPGAAAHPPATFGERLRRVAGRWGFVDFALLCADLDRTLAAVRRRGLQYAGPVAGGRRRPDGVQVAWRAAFPADRVLPFLIEDRTPRALRVPPSTPHPNGASGVEEVEVAARDLDAAGRAWRTLLGLPAAPAAAGLQGSPGGRPAASPAVSVAVGSTRVVLRPAGDGAPAGMEGPQTLRLRGGPCLSPSGWGI